MAFLMPCHADVTLAKKLADSPNLVGTGFRGLYGISFDGNGKRSLVAVGDTSEGDIYDQTVITQLGPLTAGKLARSQPLLPYYSFNGAVAVSQYPQPLLLLAGYVENNSEITDGIDVFAGSPLQRQFSRPMYTLNAFNAATLTRVAGPADFDVVLGATNGLTLWSAKAGSPTWTLSVGSVTALATLPATSTASEKLIVAGGEVELRDLSDGHLIWSTPVSGGSKILVGNIKGNSDPEFVVIGAGPGVAAFASNPPALLWQKAGSYVDGDLYDRSGNGVSQIVLTDYDQHLSWLDGSGNTLTTKTLPARAGPVAVANVTGSAASVITMTTDMGSSYDGTDIWPLTLAAETAHQPADLGPFDPIAVGDLDGSGRDKLVTISHSLDDSSGRSSRLRIIDPASGSVLWSGSVLSQSAPPESDSFYDVAITHLSTGSKAVIALLGQSSDPPFGSEIVYIDGVTHSVLKRMPFVLPDNRVPTHLRMIDVDGDGIPEVVIFSQPYARVFVLRSDTLASLWTSPVLGDGGAAAWIGVRPARAGSAPRLLVTLPGAGLWSVNLGTHLVDYTVTADANAAAYLPASTGNDRIAFLDNTNALLRIVDAATGADLDQIPFAQKYRALANDPTDEQRLLMAADDHVVSVHLDDHRRENMSPSLGFGLARSGTMVTRQAAGNAVAYIGNDLGVWSLTVTPRENSIFADNFELW